MATIAPVSASPPLPAATAGPRSGYVVSIAQAAEAGGVAPVGSPGSRRGPDQDANRASQPAGVVQAGAVAAVATPQTIERAAILGAIRLDVSAPVKQGSVSTPARPGSRTSDAAEAPRKPGRRLDLSV